MAVICPSTDLINKLDMVIHSGVVTAYKSVAIELWYLFRCLDVDGVGKLAVSLDSVTEILDLSPRQVEVHLNKLQREKLVRHYSITNGVITVYYSSVKKVCKFLECDLGYCFFLGLTQLKELKKHTVLANFQNLQTKAESLVKEDFNKKKIDGYLSHEYLKSAYDFVENNEQLKPFGVQQTEDLFPIRPLTFGYGVIGFVEEKKTLLISKNIKIAFVSYKKAAGVLGITLKTLQDYLKDAQKIRIGYYKANNAALRDSLLRCGSKMSERFLSFKRASGKDLVIEMSGVVLLEDEYIAAKRKL
jgi:hypothetical protein